MPTAPPPVTGASTYSGPFTGPQSATPPPAYAPFPNAEARTAGTARPTAEDTVWGSEGAPWEQRQPETTATRPRSRLPEPAAPSEPEAPVVPPENEEPKDDRAEPEARVVPPEPLRRDRPGGSDDSGQAARTRSRK